MAFGLQGNLYFPVVIAAVISIGIFTMLLLKTAYPVPKAFAVAALPFAATLWNILFLAINTSMVAALLMERAEADHMSPDEKVLYTTFFEKRGKEKNYVQILSSKLFKLKAKFSSCIHFSTCFHINA